MVVSPISNNPAGRLKALFDVFYENPDPKPLSAWWEVVAREVAEDGDPYTVRAEAGALLRDVEQAARVLPAEDDPESLLAERKAWSRPIFGWQMLDSGQQQETAENLIPPPAVRALGALAGHLRRDLPEYTFIGDPATLANELGRLQKRLAELLLHVNSDSDLPDASRVSIVQLLVQAQDDLTYVRLRGLARLHRDLQAAHTQSAIAADSPEVQAEPERLARVRQWSAALLEVVATVERIIVPAAVTVAVAISSKDIVYALSAGTASRYALGASANAEPKQITAGPEGEEGPEQ